MLQLNRINLIVFALVAIFFAAPAAFANEREGEYAEWRAKTEALATERDKLNDHRSRSDYERYVFYTSLDKSGQKMRDNKIWNIPDDYVFGSEPITYEEWLVHFPKDSNYHREQLNDWDTREKYFEFWDGLSDSAAKARAEQESKEAERARSESWAESSNFFKRLFRFIEWPIWWWLIELIMLGMFITLPFITSNSFTILHFDRTSAPTGSSRVIGGYDTSAMNESVESGDPFVMYLIITWFVIRIGIYLFLAI
jgi:hypothetical protein